MKNIDLMLGVFLLLFLSSCSDQLRVKSDYDREVDFSHYKTYGWLSAKDIEQKNNPLIYNELADKRIKKAIDGQFQIKQIGWVADNPDLLVHYHIIIDNKSALWPDPYGYYSPYWIRSRMDVYQYREGTLIIDLMDSKNNLVWRGWAVSVLDINEIDLSEEKIHRAVNQILSEYPPVKK